MVRNDMTTGPEWKLILLFSLPIMFGQLLQQLYSTIDGIVVGNFVGETALAAVGTCASLTMLFLAFAMGLSNGAGIMIAQFFGAKRIEDLRQAASTAFLMLGAMGVLFALLGVVLARPLLAGLMNVAAGEIRELAVVYFRIYAIGLVFQFGYNAVAYVLRAVGDSRATMYFLCVSAVMNLVLDLLFVIVFHWGVTGAAVATVFAQFCSMVASILYMNKKYEMLRFSLSELRFFPDKGSLCLRLGIPTTLQQIAISFGNVLVQRLINSFGQFTMAACTVGMRIEAYVMVPIMGLNMAMSNFTGQNVGADRFDRVRRGLHSTILMQLCFTLVMSSTVFFLAPPLSRLFGVTGESLKQAVENIRFQSWCFLIFAVYLSFSGLFQGSGDVMFATLGSLSSLSIRVIFAYLFAYVVHLGYPSCWYSIPIGWIFSLGLVFFRYRSGKWKEKSVAKRMNQAAKEA